MQSSKTSKQSPKKTTGSAAAPEGTKPATEAKKAVRSTRASQSKKTVVAEPVSAAVKSHRGSASTSSVAIPEVAGTKAVSVSKQPAHEEIAVLAYSYWVQRGYEHGYADHDWHRAIQQLSRS